MVARTEPAALVVTLERDGEAPILLEAPDGERALWRLIRLLMAHRKLQAGDRITVAAAE